MISHASLEAISKAQTESAGIGEKLGVENEDEIQQLVNEVRYRRK